MLVLTNYEWVIKMKMLLFLSGLLFLFVLQQSSFSTEKQALEEDFPLPLNRGFGIKPKLIIVDGDIVEPKNIGRQRFIEEDFSNDYKRFLIDLAFIALPSLYSFSASRIELNNSVSEIKS